MILNFYLAGQGSTVVFFTNHCFKSLSLSTLPIGKEIPLDSFFPSKYFIYIRINPEIGKILVFFEFSLDGPTDTDDDFCVFLFPK